MRLFRFIAILGAVAATTMAQQAGATLVTWDTPTQISNGATADLDVSTAGTLHSAVNISSAAAAVVNGVTFAVGTGTSFDSGNVTLVMGGANFNFGGLGTSTGNTDYDALLGPTRASVDPGVLTFNNLTDGQEYQVQLWANDSRFIPTLYGRTTTVQDPDGGSLVTLLQNDGGTSPNLGQYVIGTFTAGGTTQVINIDGSVGPNITAVQIRVAAVPEPSSFGFGLVVLGLGMARARSRKRLQ